MAREVHSPAFTLATYVHLLDDDRQTRCSSSARSRVATAPARDPRGGYARVPSVSATVDEFMDEYIGRYSERDVNGVTELCLAPFLAIREGVPIHMPDRDAVRDHFGAMIDAYRGGGVATWKRIESDTRELGEHAVFTTVRWNALDSEGNVLRDTRTTYHLLATPDGWRLLSYTNHF
jgi:SnoaL-like domain